MRRLPSGAPSREGVRHAPAPRPRRRARDPRRVEPRPGGLAALRGEPAHHVRPARHAARRQRPRGPGRLRAPPPALGRRGAPAGEVSIVRLLLVVAAVVLAFASGPARAALLPFEASLRFTVGPWGTVELTGSGMA